MNYNDLQQHINDYIQRHQTAIDNGEEEYDYELVRVAIVNGDYNIEELPIQLVYETQSYHGENKEWVFEHKNGDESVFVMFTGWYSSYKGSEVDKYFKEVKPYIFTETRYK